jgi:uracil-DNA glycosylase
VILLVGQAPSRDGADRLEGSSGRRLAKLAGVSHAELMILFERTNLVGTYPGGHPLGGDYWPAGQAERQARLLEEVETDGTIAVGQAVARAFGWEALTPFRWHRSPCNGPRRVAWVYHPSGLNRAYNARETREEASRFLSSVVEEARSCAG